MRFNLFEQQKAKDPHGSTTHRCCEPRSLPPAGAACRQECTRGREWVHGRPASKAPECRSKARGCRARGPGESSRHVAPGGVLPPPPLNMTHWVAAAGPGVEHQHTARCQRRLHEQGQLPVHDPSVHEEPHQEIHTPRQGTYYALEPQSHRGRKGFIARSKFWSNGAERLHAAREADRAIFAAELEPTSE